MIFMGVLLPEMEGDTEHDSDMDVDVLAAPSDPPAHGSLSVIYA